MVPDCLPKKGEIIKHIISYLYGNSMLEKGRLFKYSAYQKDQADLKCFDNNDTVS